MHGCEDNEKETGVRNGQQSIVTDSAVPTSKSFSITCECHLVPSLFLFNVIKKEAENDINVIIKFYPYHTYKPYCTYIYCAMSSENTAATTAKSVLVKQLY